MILGFARDDEENDNDNENITISQIKWIGELIDEHQVRALPRSMEQLGRCYDSREFWATFELMPVRTFTTG
jgi:hypothetical protein